MTEAERNQVIEECALIAIKNGDLLEIHSPRIAEAIRSLKRFKDDLGPPTPSGLVPDPHSALGFRLGPLQRS